MPQTIKESVAVVVAPPVAVAASAAVQKAADLDAARRMVAAAIAFHIATADAVQRCNIAARQYPLPERFSGKAGLPKDAFIVPALPGKMAQDIGESRNVLSATDVHAANIIREKSQVVTKVARGLKALDLFIASRAVMYQLAGVEAPEVPAAK